MFAKVGPTFDILKPLTANSILGMEHVGAEWTRQRRLASPGFNWEVLERLTMVASRMLSESLFPKWDKYGASGNSSSCCEHGTSATCASAGKSMDVVDSITRYTLDLLG